MTKNMFRRDSVKNLLLLTLTAFVLFSSAAEASVVSETDGLFIGIVLESRHDVAVNWDVKWEYEAQGDGAIEEISMRDYFNETERELNKNAENASADEDEVFMLPSPLPGGGTYEYYFKGVRPGLVALRVTCTSPGRSAPFVDARFRLAVFSDLKISVIASSEKYNWPTP